MHSASSVASGIEYLLDSKVDAVDIKGKSLKLAKGGDNITYDKLIIGTGSTVSFLLCSDKAFVSMLQHLPNVCFTACLLLQRAAA